MNKHNIFLQSINAGMKELRDNGKTYENSRPFYLMPVYTKDRSEGSIHSCP